MIEEIIVPDIGEGVASGKVVAVHLKVGHDVAVDDPVVELETDKAVVEIPSTVKGRVIEIVVREGDELKVGGVIARVEIQTVASTQPPSSMEETQTASARAEEVPSDEEVPLPPEQRPLPRRDEPGPPDKPMARKALPEQKAPATPVPASPAIRRLARELGVDIYTVAGSGPGGRISETDIKSHVKNRMRAPSIGLEMTTRGIGEPELPDFTRWGEVEVAGLETVRRIAAQSTITSRRTIAHVTQFDKADITHLEAFVRKNAQKVSQAGGKLTVTAVLTKVSAEALKKYPRFNASIDLRNERMIYKQYVHIGIAVDTPRGLLMPVIRNADAKSITELAVEIVDLARRSREKKIKSTELEGGTFSISNQGSIGGVGFTPIVLWPQAAILGVSRAAMEPKMVDGAFQPRRMLPLSLSYDHRIIDGADAARFLGWICECLEHPFTLQLG